MFLSRKKKNTDTFLVEKETTKNTLSRVMLICFPLWADEIKISLQLFVVLSFLSVASFSGVTF